MNQELGFAICEHLALSNPTKDAFIAAELSAAIKTIQRVYQVDLDRMEDIARFSIAPATLSSIFEVYQSTRKTMSSANTEKPAKVSTAEAKAKAELIKTDANKFMAAKNYDEAIALYSKAIALNASAVYYANRAAAYSQKADYESAASDSRKAIEIDNAYSKGYARLGHAMFGLERYQEAVEAYEKALELEPTNASMKQSLAAAQQKAGSLAKRESTPASEDPFAALSGMGGMGGMGDMDFGAILNNPNFMSMAASMMQNNPKMAGMMDNPQVKAMLSNPSALASMMQQPGMKEMAANLMKDPSAMEDMMKNGTGPDLSKFTKQ